MGNHSVGNELLIYYQNIGGMNSNIVNYALACSDSSYDVYAFTESWLNSNTPSHLIFGPCYNVFRLDRSSTNSSKRTGGGVLLAIRSHFKTRQLFPPISPAVEQVWVALSLTDRLLFICVIYIPPDRTNDATVIEQHLNSLSWITSQMEPRDEVLIIGDFNLPGITWKQTQSNQLFPDPSGSSISVLASKLLDEYSTANAIQINNELNSNNRILDLCFVSSDLAERCSVVKAASPLVKLCQHHPPLDISVLRTTPSTFTDTTEKVYYDYSKADFSSMNRFISAIDWHALLDRCDVNKSAEMVSNILLYAIDQYVPKKPRKIPLYPPWTNSNLKKLKSRKRSALKKLTKNRTDQLKAHYITVNNQYKRLNKQLFCSHQRNVQQKLKLNPKSFWKYINEQRNESGLPTVMVRSGKEASTTDEICKQFREQFSMVFSDESLDSTQISRATSNVPCLPPIGPHPLIDVDAVQKACSKLKSSTSSGPDGIPSIIIKKCSDGLCIPLSLLFNLSLRSGIFPSCWKSSYVFPVHKKGSKRDVSNYRGIAALCALSKLFEVLVIDFVSHSTSNYISKDQHGFVPKRSTSTNLVIYTSFLTRALQRGQQVDAIYTDLSAAFDKINHRITLAKLKRLGFNGSLLNWLQSYLCGREMSVKIGDTLSTPFPVTSGVPQGSHLGPLIFLLYLNDVNIALKCLKLSYADDFKLYLVINTLKDARFLQQQLDHFREWCETNRMVLNASKCSIITFSRKRSNITFNYNISGIVLPRENCVKDLGIMLDSKLTYKEHVSYIVSKASKTLGFIFRTAKYFKSIECLKALYCSLVRSLLEFSSVVWAPFYQNSINRIEAVQHKFVRFALRHLPWNDPINLPSYEDRCKLIGLDLLTVRRDVAKAIFVSDLLKSHIDCTELLDHMDFDIRRRNLRSHAFFRLPTARTNYAQNEPVSRMCRVFNQCYNVFDFHLSRSTVKQRFLNTLSNL